MKKVLLFSALCLGLCACAKEAPVQNQEMNEEAAQEEMLVTDTTETEETPTAVVTEETVTATPVAPAAEVPATK